MSEKTLCKENDIKLTTKDQDQKKKKKDAPMQRKKLCKLVIDIFDYKS